MVMLEGLAAIHNEGSNLLNGKVVGQDPLHTRVFLLEDHLGGSEEMEVHGELALELGYILVPVVDHIDTRENLIVEVLLKSVEKGQSKRLDRTEQHVEYIV